MRSWLRTFSPVCLLLLLICGASSDISAGIRLEFDNPGPQVVSNYRPAITEFYIAKRKSTILALMPDFNLTPRVTASYFHENYFTFNTEYRPGDSLVPVSVGAIQYNNFRRNRYLRDQFSLFGQKTYAAQQTKTGPGGVSIGIGLPKQLDKVFGEGGGNLKVSGYRRISFSGRSSWTDGSTGDALKQSKFPSLMMDQVYRFDIEGTIGSKISVKVSEDSQTDIPLANRIMLRYKGDEDDIIKTIEAGNTTLSLPNTQFVGYSSSIQGLFGLKTEAQIGRFKLTAIASQEKGSSERSTVSATGESKADNRRDFEYVENRIFDLRPAGDTLLATDSVTYIEVYEHDQNATGTNLANDIKADLYIDPREPFLDTLSGGREPRINMMKIDENQYYPPVNDAKRNRHYLVFTSAQQSRGIGVYMKVRRLQSDGVTYGPPFEIGSTTLSTTDSAYSLMMLRPTTLYTPTHPTWKLMWRNVYSIPTGVAPEDLNFKIFKGAYGTEGSGANLETQDKDGAYIKLMGLDQINRQGQPQADGILDDRSEIYRRDWGLLIFPSREPFASDTTFTIGSEQTVKLQETTDKIYNYRSDAERTTNSRYYIQMSSKVRGSVINLNRANIIEGSERVTANGKQLTRNTDYTIDYSFGRVTLISTEATDPNAAVNVDFEYAPFLSLQKKTLVGLRGEYALSSDFKFGSTYLYKSDKAENRKPRVGQETAKMSVLDFDGTWKVYPKFMTKLANALPFVATDVPSNLTISGEYAESRPNPNVDNVAYIDDFEAALEQLSLPSNRTSWSTSTVPVQIQQQVQAKLYQKGKLLWHNVPNGIPVDSVYDRQSAAGQGTINFLRLVFRPKNKLVGSDSANPTLVKSWAGIMTYFGNAVDPYRAQLFEVRLQGTRGKIHFDFGRISEDLDGNGSPSTEDVNANGTCDSLEDTGLDHKFDKDEGDSLHPYDAIKNPDPDDDDYYSQGVGVCPLPGNACGTPENQQRFNNPNDPLYYEYLNGTEGNLKDVSVLGQPDEEQLSRNSFNTVNSYFSYKIDLSDTTSDTSFYVQSSNLNGWRTYRIPIMDPRALDTTIIDGGTPDWALISHVRVWFEADDTATAPDTVRVANWYFVQSNWQDSLITRRVHDTTTTFVVASVSTEDHIFIPPPGVTAYTDPTSNVTEPQRGLSLAYKNIHNSDTCLAVKKLASVDTYSGYRRLQMYVHGDTGPGSHDSVLFFFRLGADSVNYYEYHALVHPDWDPQNYVDIDFNTMTALKDAAQRALAKGVAYTTVDTADGHYRVKGNPSISTVQYLACGAVNLDTTRTATGTIWLDELRVTDVRRDVGQAGRISFSGTMADLASYDFRMESRNPYFRGISATTRGGSSDNLGSGQSSNSYSFSTSINMEKFVPRGWGASLPIGYSFSKTTQTPVLASGSDVILPPEQQIAQRSVSVSKGFRAAESFSYKGRSPLFNLFLNRQKVGFSYSRSNSFDVNRPYSFGESYNVTGQFDMGVRKSPSFKLFPWAKSIPILNKTKGSKFYFWPLTWNLNGTFNRSLAVNDDINHKRVSSLQRGLDLRSSTDYKIMDNLTTRFEWSTQRDLSDPTQVDLAKFKLGVETNYTQSFSATYAPRFFRWIGSGFSYSSNYADNLDRSTMTRYSTLNNQWGVSGDFKHLVFLGKKDAGAGGGSTPKPVPSKPGKSGKSQPKSISRPFYDPPLAVLRFLTGWVDPFQYKYNRTYTSTLPGMLVRPSMGYRLGFYRDARVPISGGDNRSVSSGEGYSYEVSTRFQVMGGISTNIGYKTSITRDLIKQGSRNQRTSTSWPSLDVSISKFKTFPLIKKQLNRFIEVFEPQTAFTRQIQEDRNIDGGFRTGYTVTTGYNPLLSVRFKVWRSLSMSTSYALTLATNDQHSTTTGQLQKESKSSTRSINLTARYSFRAPAGMTIPLFGKIKVTSTVNMQLDVRKGSSKTESSNNGGAWTIFEDKGDFVVSPTISYSFSQQIQGGLTGMWQDTNDNYTHKKSHVRQLQIWAEIRF